ncbi:ribosomal protein S18 acetylase RimI-like enzyme [Luteibacter sp. OK325]|uniref:GNAT family N-acetyltransferase n=1 Tax=Luteibacter sp. OK325 TaxID=2135670 RepID=UPI000D3544B7|nr:GNAT family N-acetyltransferase [Luteibacter sp. OK325]PTR33940.1 ribosomal protein S18 acetylase RimI-like enzyme [Luteibacter sp. OK325]
METSAQLIIRPATPDDFQKWTVLWDGYNTFYGREGETALPAEITAATWRRFFDGYEPMYAVVAEQAGELIGLAHFLLHRSTTQIQPNCYLQDVFTAERARGKGVARGLIEEVYTRATALGAGRVYWQTHESNTTAMYLYDKIAQKSGFLVYRKLL